MIRNLALIGSALVLALLYLLLWPVPIDPVAWEAPVNQGLVDPFETNDQMKFLRSIDLGEYSGPEDVALGADGQLYATTAGGKILRIDSSGRITEFADTGGRPLGIETDADGSLVVANAYVGIQRIQRNGSRDDTSG